MKRSVITFLFFLPFLSNGQSNPFHQLKYDKVMAYEFQGDGHVLIETCLHKEKEKVSKEVELSKDRIDRIESILTYDKGYGNGTAFCFDPHIAIVYYHKDKIVGTIDICLDCNYLVSSEKIPATEIKKIKITDDYSHPAKGFSKKTRKEIYNFFKELGFEKYLKPYKLESSFDN